MPPFGPNLLSPQWQPERFRAMIYSHVARQRVRWWKAIRSADYDPRQGRRTSSDPNANTSEWNYTEQLTAANGALVSTCRALVMDVDLNSRYAQWGQLAATDQLLITMPDELPIGQHDLVQPLGNNAGEVRTFRFTEAVTRAGTLVPQTGTISSSGTAVTGIGTLFNALLPGDVISAAGRTARVVSITDNLHLTVDTAPSPAWNGLAYSKGYDPLLHDSVMRIESILAADGTPYASSSYTVGIDSQSIQWISGTPSGASPAPGARYSVVYWFAPRYYSVPDLGQPGPIVGSTGLPQKIMLRVYQPETMTR